MNTPPKAKKRLLIIFMKSWDKCTESRACMHTHPSQDFQGHLKPITLPSPHPFWPHPQHMKVPGQGLNLHCHRNNSWSLTWWIVITFYLSRIGCSLGLGLPPNNYSRSTWQLSSQVGKCSPHCLKAGFSFPWYLFPLYHAVNNSISYFNLDNDIRVDASDNYHILFKGYSVMGFSVSPSLEENIAFPSFMFP